MKNNLSVSQENYQETIDVSSAPQNDIAIYVGGWDIISLCAGLIIPLLIFAWFISSRLTKVTTIVDNLETRFTNLEGRMDNSFAASSPIALLEKGNKILNNSGLKEYIDKNKDSFLKICKSKKQMNTQYDIQSVAFDFFDEHDFTDYEDKLKKTAYEYGVSIDIMRRISGIYFRDICLREHGFCPEDLDKPKTV